MTVGVRSGFEEIIDRVVVTRLPAAVCSSCRHPKALHRDGGPCYADGCRCLRVGIIGRRHDDEPVLISR